MTLTPKARSPQVHQLQLHDSKWVGARTTIVGTNAGVKFWIFLFHKVV